MGVGGEVVCVEVEHAVEVMGETVGAMVLEVGEDEEDDGEGGEAA